MITIRGNRPVESGKYRGLYRGIGVRLDVCVFVPGLLLPSQVLPQDGASFPHVCADDGSLDSFLQQIVETNPVRLVKENILANVPT